MSQYERWRGNAGDRQRWRDEDRFGGYGREPEQNDWRQGRGAEGPARDWNRNVALGGEDHRSDWNWNRRGSDDFGRMSDRDRGREYAGHRRDEEGGFGNNDRSPSFSGRYARPGTGRDNGRPASGRGVWDRASDEMSSWFGDQDAEHRREADARHGDAGARHHIGRGPKGYTRSDERIREDLSDRLSDDPYVDASDIEVAVSGREVTLSGTVDSRNAKRRAEDIAERVSAVTHVSNNLRVRGRTTADDMAAGLTGASFMGGTGAI